MSYARFLKPLHHTKFLPVLSKIATRSAVIIHLGVEAAFQALATVFAVVIQWGIVGSERPCGHLVVVRLAETTGFCTVFPFSPLPKDVTDGAGNVLGAVLVVYTER